MNALYVFRCNLLFTVLTFVISFTPSFAFSQSDSSDMCSLDCGLMDLNKNALIEDNDLQILQSKFGSSASSLDGDVDGDGKIGLSELNLLRNCMGFEIPELPSLELRLKLNLDSRQSIKMISRIPKVTLAGFPGSVLNRVSWDSLLKYASYSISLDTTKAELPDITAVVYKSSGRTWFVQFFIDSSEANPTTHFPGEPRLLIGEKGESGLSLLLNNKGLVRTGSNTTFTTMLKTGTESATLVKINFESAQFSGAANAVQAIRNCKAYIKSSKKLSGQ